jgi:hypothetical protein
MIIPYCELDLQLATTEEGNADIGLEDLTIGPTNNADLLRESLKLALRQFDIHAPQITGSKAPYRSL